MDIRSNYASGANNELKNEEDGRRRRLQVVEVASKDDPILKDLWEIQVEVHRARDGFDNSNINSYLNKEREYLYRVNPLNLSLCDEWKYQEKMDNATDRNNEPQVIFKLNPNSYALITLDLRHLKE